MMLQGTYYVYVANTWRDGRGRATRVRPGQSPEESRETAESLASLSLGLCSLSALALANLACLFGCPRSASAGRQVDDLEAMHAREGHMENGGKTLDELDRRQVRDTEPRLLLAFAPLLAGRTRSSRQIR